MEFVIGAVSAMGAVVFTNPLEVIKTRFQLQGELKVRGAYTVHYKNFFHAGYVIVKGDGLLALQKGLVPALWHQVMLNGVRLGGYQMAEEHRLNLKPNGEVSLFKTTAIGAVMGAVGAYTGSPLYLIKTRAQAQANIEIAVGHQHRFSGMVEALKNIYSAEGVSGLWRGVTGAVYRLAVGSGAQLGAFYTCREYLEDNPYCTVERGILNTFIASMIGGVVVALAMAPLDVVSTRLYNQGVDHTGKGLLYSGMYDCTKKIFVTEGIWGLYKGIVPCYMRIGPHTVLCFVFWEQLKSLQEAYQGSDRGK